MRTLFKYHIYEADLPYIDGSIQCGKRPIIIVSNEKANIHSPVVHYVPLTSKVKNKLPVHHLLKMEDYNFLQYDSTVLCEQLMGLSKDRIGKFIGVVNEKDIIRINRCIKTQLN